METRLRTSSRPARHSRACRIATEPRPSHHLPHRSGGADVMIVLLALALYAAAGFAVAVAFLVFGVTRAAGACPSDVGRADSALSRRRRALALRARPLAEILPM